MDFELIFPSGFTQYNQRVSWRDCDKQASSDGTPELSMIVHEQLAMEHLWAWHQYTVREREKRLEEALQEALQNEDYETAARLRDELGKAPL